jgi:glycosyltransferase involved in cell wall biosynthesis
MISIIIPAHNEADYITACLEDLLVQDASAGPLEIIVVPNGCLDNTAEIARRHAAAFQKRGWPLKVVELEQGSKPDALNAGDAAATGEIRMYLDADIRCDPALVGQLRAALVSPRPAYATGRLALSPPRSRISRLYGEFWQMLPFIRGGAVGAGCYAVNAAGRARWDQFPKIIADDSFARLQFNPSERVEVSAQYHWPMAEGFRALVRVRRRQDAGMRELFAHYPELAATEAKSTLTIGYLLDALWRRPLAGLIYILVSVAVRAKGTTREWARGR